MTSGSGKQEDRDHWATQAKYQRTGNVLYAVLAIGYWRSQPNTTGMPPNWALDACAAEFERSIDGQTVITQRKGPKSSRKDRARIAEVAALRLAWMQNVNGQHLGKKPPPLGSLFRQILLREGMTDEDAIASNVRRLKNQYGPEHRDEDGNWINERVTAAARPYVNRRKNAASKPSSEVDE